MAAKIPVQILLDPEDHEEIEKIVEEEGSSASAVGRRFIREKLRERRP